MLISIVIPIYNVEEYLPGCLDSVLKNDLTDCEVILVDDGSPDRCGSICDRYAAQYPDTFTVFHQQNGGIGAARNTGVEAARGEWLLFVDSDDKIHPETIAKLKTAIQTPGTDVVSFGFFADNGVDPPVPQGVGFPPSEKPFCLSEKKDFLLTLPSVWMRLWKRELFTETGIRFPSKVWYEDVRTIAKLLAAAKGIVVLPDSFYYYLTRQGSVMNNQKVERNREILDAMDDILSWYRSNGLYDEYYTELEAMTVRHVMLAASVRVARIDPKTKLLKEFREYTAEHFPEWRRNPYNRSLSRMKRLALWLVAHRQYGMIRVLYNLKG